MAQRPPQLPQTEPAPPQPAGAFVDSPETKVFRVRHTGAPQPLRDYLLARYRHGRSAAWAASFYPGRVRLDGMAVDADTVVRPGQEIAYLHNRADEPPTPPPPPVLHEDEWLLAVHKPDTVPVNPSGVYYFTALVLSLRERFGLPELTPMHRLDLETSGPILFAKRRGQVAAFHALFTQGRMHKRYRALSWGHVPTSQREIAGHIVPDADSPIHTRLRLIPTATDAPASLTRIHAVTHLHHALHGALSELLLEPVTGKTNQLRVHLAAIGHPIVGDKKYHPDPAVFLDWYTHRDFTRLRGTLLLPRQALMCDSLAFPHPFTGEPLHIAAPAGAWAEKLSDLDSRDDPLSAPAHAGRAPERGA